MEDKANTSEPIVNHKTGETKSQLLAKLPVPGPGTKKQTEEQRAINKSRKQLVEEYKDALAESLPFINPVLVAKAIQGDIQAIKEINDVIVEKATRNTDITSGGKPIPLLGGITKNDGEGDIQKER